jgi:hypothetical protein
MYKNITFINVNYYKTIIFPLVKKFKSSCVSLGLAYFYCVILFSLGNFAWRNGCCWYVIVIVVIICSRSCSALNYLNILPSYKKGDNTYVGLYVASSNHNTYYFQLEVADLGLILLALILLVFVFVQVALVGIV